MTTLRVFRCYRRLKRPYTRKSRFKRYNFIRAMPNHKITRFDMGDMSQNYPNFVKLMSKVDINIRHNAIEASRMIINRELQEKIGKIGYKFKINKYPHHALRENKMLGGAHADRIQTGMAHSFGKVVSLAVRWKKGTPLFTAQVKDLHVEIAKKALLSIAPKLPCKVFVVVDKK
ncbi:50S ribosomal protein L16 [Candidatus Woesearchaeota archaeon]|nr:50S ribosomal protein L16 [Candidatus Woesearchaeota archaeon]